MTPSFWNSSCNNYSKYPNDLHNEDHLGHHQFLSSNSQASSSSNFLTTCLFLNSSVHDQDQILNRESHPPRLQQEGDNFESQPYNDHRIVNNHEDHNQSEAYMVSDQNQNQLKWMSSKMRVMLKMKKSDPVNILNTSREATNVEEHKLPPSPMEELTDNSSNSTSPNNSIPIRVCSDCNTTKTPLWRSGPRGPKSLCNACGIRQRKARRALAAAATESGKNNDLIHQSIIAPLKVTKTQPKDHKKTSIGLVTKYKKRRIYSKQIVAATTTTLPPSRSPSPSPLPSPPSSSPVRKNCVEEFLASLSKNLTFYHVFPQDEKEAAILLMALSCGYAHET